MGSAQQANCKLIIGPGGPQRLPILCGNPLLKPPGLSFGTVRMIGLFVADLLLVVALVGVMVWLFFLRGR